MTTREVSASDIKAVVAKLKSAPVSKRLGERLYISEELFRIAVNNQAKEKEVKKYRLKKDTPTIKAGTIFQEVTSDYDKSRELVRIMPLGSTTSPQWTIDDIHNFDEWFEEVKEFQPFKCMTSGMVSVMRGCSGGIEEFYHSTGNCYPINTPDEAIIKEQKLIPQAMHRLRMAAKKAWFEFNGSEGPDWSNRNQAKWGVYYGHSDKMFVTGDGYSVQCHAPFYFPTEKSCQAYIDNNPEDMKLLFGVER